MVVLVSDVERVCSVEPERDTPVGIDTNRPPTGPVCGQRMQAKARKRHIVRLNGHIEPTQNEPQSIGMMSRDSCFRACSKEQSKPFVSEGAYQL